MSPSTAISVTFWGTRGSVPCPGPDTLRFGGNTTCVEFRIGDSSFVVDGGTGIINCGRDLLKRGRDTLDVYFTHTHWDHVCGLPFFGPAYVKGFHVDFHAGHLGGGKTLHSVLAKQMMEPLFPVPLDILNDCTFEDFTCGSSWEVNGDTLVRTCPLNHPNGAVGYRVERDGRAVCFITDVEHRPESPDPALVAFCRGADIMIYDAMFTDEEYARHVGWGHSTWQEALRLGDAAEVGQVVLFHHHPERTDTAQAAIEAAAAAVRPGTIAAREGSTIGV